MVPLETKILKYIIGLENLSLKDPENKILLFDKMCQNKLNTIENQEICRRF